MQYTNVLALRYFYVCTLYLIDDNNVVLRAWVTQAVCCEKIGTAKRALLSAIWLVSAFRRVSRWMHALLEYVSSLVCALCDTPTLSCE